MSYLLHFVHTRIRFYLGQINKQEPKYSNLAKATPRDRHFRGRG